MNVSTAQVIGDAITSGDRSALALAVLAHPSSSVLGKPALAAIGRVAYGVRFGEIRPRDFRLVEKAATAVLAFEVVA